MLRTGARRGIRALNGHQQPGRRGNDSTNDIPGIFTDIDRTDPTPAYWGESRFEFYDRVAGPFWDQVRQLVEDWSANLDPTDRNDVRGRLRSRDDRQFAGAFLELYVHQSLLAMGYTVTCHPSIAGTGRRPDFRAVDEKSTLYVEARTTPTSDADTAQAARTRAVYESLDKIDSPNFFLWIDVPERGPAPLASRPLRRELERWLSGLDPDQHLPNPGKSRRDLPGHSYSNNGWVINFRAVGKTSAARGRPGARPLGIYGGQASYLHDEQDLRKALDDKGSAYGQLDAPYVVVVGVDSVTVDDDDVINALYGSEVVQFGTTMDGHEVTNLVRKPDGYWRRGDRWSHQGVSALLVVKGLHPASVGDRAPTLWDHPAAHEAAGPLPMWRRARVGDGGVRFSEPQRRPHDWFGLPKAWPNGDPFPR